MCLLIDVEAIDVPPRTAGELTRDAAATGVLRLQAQRAPRGATTSRYLVGDGCACALLADNADWDAPFYALDSARCADLARTLEFLHGRSRRLRVRAVWAEGALSAHPPAGTTQASLAALLSDVRAGRIANNVVYDLT
jgi:hypothetical protein